ncbi:MAG: M23 family peptidase, partial [Cellulosimicrobium funkei]
MTRPVELALPFQGTWLVRNSPARRVPSHGTDLFATTYAIDFVAVRGRRTAAVRDWRTALGTEPPERFVAFGRPVLAPAAGTVVAVHDGEPDHEARRSPTALLGYALTQAARARRGAAALAGNHVVLALDPPGTYVVLAHLRAGSVAVEPGRR